MGLLELDGTLGVARHQGLKYVFINHEPVMTLTFFRVRLLRSPMPLNGVKL